MHFDRALACDGREREHGAIRSRALSVALVAALAAVGCGGNDDDSDGKRVRGDGRFEAEQLELFALKGSDLPRGYERKERETGSRDELLDRAETSAEEASLERTAAPGLQSFYAVSYRKEAGGNYSEPGSVVLLYRSAGGASRALPLVRRYVAATAVPAGDVGPVSTRRLPVSGLGDESLPGLQFSVRGLPGKSFLYAWRNRNVVVTLGWGDTFGDVSAKTLLETAKKLDSRAAKGES